MNVGFIGDMFRYTFMAKMNMTNFTIHRGHGILTQGAAHDILSATPRVHGQLNFNLKMKEVQIKEKKIIKITKKLPPLYYNLKNVFNTEYMYTQ